MWKYVSRRIRDTFERSANHFDRRSATVVNTGGISEDKNKNSDAPCRWFCPRKCWNSSGNDGGTNSNKWNFDQLNRSWIGAITWSSALVVGWYTSQLLNLKYKHSHKDNRKYSPRNIFSFLHPYIDNVDKKAIALNSISKFEKIASTFTPTVYLISNDSTGEKSENKADTSTESTTNPDLSSDDDLGDVLNSIENRLGLAAIENGQHKDGLNLLRSAANRNHAPALYNLGICYEMGLGVAVNEKTAMELYKSAAALEHPGALYNLGIYYGQGRGGLTRDVKTAMRLLRLAAVQGQQDAIDALKTLEPELPVPREEDDSWFNYSPYTEPESVVPVQTTLFVDNVNYHHSHNEGRVY